MNFIDFFFGFGKRADQSGTIGIPKPNRRITVSVSGGGHYQVGGTFYAANALVSISGNGRFLHRFAVHLAHAQLRGTGALTIDYTASVHPGQRVLSMAE